MDNSTLSYSGTISSYLGESPKIVGLSNTVQGNLDVEGPDLVVAIMIKNEADVIVATLQPFLAIGVDHILVLDTGSTDNTQEVVRDFFKKNNMTHGFLFCEEFVDFSTSRNRALELAENTFNKATFIIMPDAEWYLKNGEALLEYCRSKKNDTNPVYDVSVAGPTNFLYRDILFRRNQRARFFGAVHEYAYPRIPTRLPPNIYFEYNPSDQGVRKTEQRYQRDKNLLLKDYAKDPKKARTLFYLAQTCCCRHEWKEAYKYYSERTRVVGVDDEEDAITYYRLGVLIEKIGETDPNYTWEMAFNCYVKSFMIRPQRIDVLVLIANHYLWVKDPETAYFYIKKACNMPIPESEFMVVETYMYDYQRYAIYARCAFFLGDLDKGEEAALLALKGHPQDHAMIDLLQKIKQYRNTANIL